MLHLFLHDQNTTKQTEMSHSAALLHLNTWHVCQWSNLLMHVLHASSVYVFLCNETPHALKPCTIMSINTFSPPS
jgi:hypothetical protein